MLAKRVWVRARWVARGIKWIAMQGKEKAADLNTHEMFGDTKTLAREGGASSMGHEMYEQATSLGHESYEEASATAMGAWEVFWSKN